MRDCITMPVSFIFTIKIIKRIKYTVKGEMMSIKLKISVVLTCVITISALLLVCSEMSKNSEEAVLKKQLYDKAKYNVQIDKEHFIRYADKKSHNLNGEKKIISEDYFFIAYEKYLNENMDEAQKYCRLSIENKSDNMDNMIKIYNGFLLDSITVDSSFDEEFVSVAREIFEGLDTKDINEYDYIIYNYMLRLINRKNGPDMVIETVERFLEDEKKLKSDTVALMKNFLQVLYANMGNYAKGLERCLETIRLIETEDIEYEDYYKAKSLGNMGLIYFYIGDYKSAADLIEQSLLIEIQDRTKNKNSQVVNLSLLLIIAGFNEDLAEMDRLLGLISQSVSGDFTESIDMIYLISSVEYYIKKYEISTDKQSDFKYLEKAEYCLENVKAFLNENGNSIINELDVNYGNKLYYMNYLKGNHEEALTKLEDLAESYDNHLYKKYILQDIIKIYSNTGNYEKAYKYSIELGKTINDEMLLISKDYADFSFEKHDNEINMKYKSKKRDVEHIFIFFTTLIFSIVSIVIFMRYKALKEKNKMDGLTGIYNRNIFNEVYDKKLKSSEGFFICIFDIDNFKSVNDTYGHLIGDEVLKKVAQTAKCTLDKRGDIYRYGGEEFVILMKGKDKDFNLMIVEEIRRSIEEIKWENGMKITISSGIAQRKHNKYNPLEEADNNLYVSKMSGKNKVTWTT